MNELNSASLAASFDRPSFNPFAPTFATMSSGKTAVADASDSRNMGQDQGGFEGDRMDANSERGADTRMAPVAGGLMMDAGAGPSNMSVATGTSAMKNTAPSTMMMRPAAMMSAPHSAGRMMDMMMAPMVNPEPGPGQRALADEAFALEYNRLVDYHTRYPNFWSSIRYAHSRGIITRRS